MAINSRVLVLCLLASALGASAPAWSREAASPSACQAAATTPAIVEARSVRDGNPDDVQAQFKLADAWSDAGCFGEALQVLQAAQAAHPGNKELETRLRVAGSLVGEEHFFDDLDRADTEARLKRASFRCTSLADLDACNEALRLKPDDPALLIAQGDALVRARRPADALNRYRLAAVVAPNQRDVAARIASAESQLPAQTGGPNGGGPGVTSPGVAAVAGDRAKSAAGAAPAKAASVHMASVHTASASAAAEPPPLRAANAASTPTQRRYSNAAPETQSH
jgi:thioredoxin-like negative regulator of GroEL